jgi:ubiquinone/menaquinone biosynthesis C-methylase UbiE
MSAPGGAYPIETRSGEVERLRLQDVALAEATRSLLDLAGVAPGWRCLDLGCGPEGITHELARRVGPSGRVTGFDANAGFIQIATDQAPPNADYMLGDAYATGLPDGAFDFVHMRFLAGTAGEPERLADEAVRLTRSGGVVAAQEADFQTLRCFPSHAAFTELAQLFVNCFPEPGAEPIAHRMYRLMRARGVGDVAYRPFLTGVRAQDPWRDYLPATIESMRGTVTGRLGVAPERLAALLADCRAHLAEPDTVFTPYTVIQVWGRRG